MANVLSARHWLHCVFCVSLLFDGCFLATQPDPAEIANQVTAVCGDLKNPDSYPLSDQCISLAGRYGPILRRKSDLIVAVNQSCKATTSQKLEWQHCLDLVDSSNPSCGALAKANAAGTPEGSNGSDWRPCFEAMENEPVCQGMIANLEGYETPDCKQAKEDLKNFEGDLARAEMQEAFAPPSQVVNQRVVVRQAPSLNFSAPALVPPPPMFTNCTNFGPTTNCVTH